MATSIWMHGDAMAYLPALSPGTFDGVVTDPPYSSGGLHSVERRAAPSKKYEQGGKRRIAAEFDGDQRDQRSWSYWCVLWLSECLRVTKDGGRLLCFADWRQLPSLTDAVQAAGWIWRGVAPWNKGPGARAPHTGFHRHQCEYVVVASKGKLAKSKHGGPWNGCFNVPVKPGEKLHMCGKTLPLMREMLACLPPGGNVLDPFGGSASTGVAAIELGLSFTGFEKSKHYYEVGRDRLNAAATFALYG